MTVQQMVDSGQVPDDTVTEDLQLLNRVLDFHIRDLQEDMEGPTARLIQYQKLQVKVMDVLNRRHGADGMTPLKD
ncbi:hypothetical protein GCM10028805_52320 [Spirosoma harenae]